MKFTIKLLNVLEASYSANTNFYPTILMAVDHWHDDNTALNVPALQSYNGVCHKVLLPNKEVGSYIRQTTLQQIDSSLNGIGAAVGQRLNFDKKFINCSYPGSLHYGRKCAIDVEGEVPTSSVK